MVEGGKTPVQGAQELAALGFGIVIFPGGTARAVAHTLAGYYGSLRQHGSTTPWRDRMLDFDGLNAMIGTPELLAAGKRYEVERPRARRLRPAALRLARRKGGSGVWFRIPWFPCPPASSRAV